MQQQEFASPGEALEHFGIKGMRWGFRKDGEFSNWGSPYSSGDGLGHGNKEFELKDQKNLRVDHSNGFADVRPVGGYRSPYAQKVHDDLVKEISALRETYPNVKALKIEVVPASAHPNGPGRAAQAAVMLTKPGEVVVTYNDKMKNMSGYKQARWEQWVPGMRHEGYVARHEMGHLISAAGKITPPGWDVMAENNLTKLVAKAHAFQDANEANHKAAFARHGISFKEVSALSPYASTSASEAYAELAGNFHTPALRKQMSPEMQRKAQALFDEAGGKS